MADTRLRQTRLGLAVSGGLDSVPAGLRKWEAPQKWGVQELVILHLRNLILASDAYYCSSTAAGGHSAA